MEQTEKADRIAGMAEKPVPDRKSDHINLAIRMQTPAGEVDERFWYEPMLAGFPAGKPEAIPFAGKFLEAPLWVSSMTGGSALSGTINRNLALACREFGLGMGLGSCRRLLEDNRLFDDFNMRPVIGDERPLFANLGIAQVEELVQTNRTDTLRRMIGRLQADGLIIHVNPLQEFLQPEGNIIHHPPVETIERLLETTDIPLIVKEVGQGFGPQSLQRLLTLPLAAIEFGAFGGTNFSKLENSRQSGHRSSSYEPLVHAGVTAEEMVDIINTLVSNGLKLACGRLIISGGIRNFLDGYYLVQKSMVPSIYAQASGFLQHSRGEYAELQQFVREQLEGYRMAQNFLTLKNPVKKPQP